jgi:hypothetical protein
MNNYDLLDLINNIKSTNSNLFSTSYVTKHIFKIEKKELRINKIKKILND